MREEDSTFGVEPQRLDRLISLGLENDQDDLGTLLSPQVDGPGGQVGRYKLLRVLGEGGMGVVYLAEQTHPMRRQVALKIIKLGMDTRQVIARFEAERQALALMEHPNIARVLDAGATETGRPYFVMELVLGGSITEYCDENNLSTKERLRLFMQVCSAVQHAHQKGIIHRDLKPSNVIVTLQDGKAVPKIIDFGVAKAMDQRLTEKTLFTRDGRVIGTPVYMSPEQTELTDLEIDTRSDIYSLGVLLYELLTGTTPFSEEELRKAGYIEMQRVIRERVPAKPSTKLGALGKTATDVARRRHCTPDLLRKALRGDLDWIVMKSLEKDRTRRYETSGGLAEDIRRHLEHEPVLARGPSVTYRFGKFFRKHRSSVLAMFAMGILAGAMGITVFQWHRDRQELGRVKGQQDRAILSQAREEYAKGEKQAALKTIGPILLSAHVGAEARLLRAGILVDDGQFQEALVMLDGLITERSEIAGAAHSLWARVLWESETLDDETLNRIAYHRRQAEILRPETTEAYFLRAITAVTIKDQLAALDKALHLASLGANPLEPVNYECRRLRAFNYYVSRKYEQMRDEALAMTALRPQDPLGYSLRAMACHELGRFSEAVANYGHALERTTVKESYYVELNDRCCEALMRMGQYERVLDLARECLRNVPNAATVQAQVFLALTALGRYEEVCDLMRDVARSPGDVDNEIWLRSMKYAFDALAAGGQWHPPNRDPEQPAFLYMFEAEEMYRGLRAKARPLITDCFSPCWSPDGTKVAYTQGRPGYSGVAVYDLATNTTDLLIVPGKDPSWSPDGGRIAFVRDAQALRLSELTTGRTRGRTQGYYLGEEVWVMEADGGAPRRLAQHAHCPSWSADAGRVFYHSYTDRTLYSIAIDDPQAQPVPVCVCSAEFPSASPRGDYVANVNGGREVGAVLRIVDVAGQSCIAEWPTPLESPAGFWSPDGRELSLGGLNGIRARTGLWIYDLTKNEGVKVLSGHFGGAFWSPDRTRLLIHLGQPYWEIWIAELDPNLSTAESLRPVQTLEEHCLEAIATCTQDLQTDPDSIVDRWTRATSALWIGHSQASVYLDELDRRLGRPPIRASVLNAGAAHNILAHPALRERLEPLAFVMARRAVEQRPGHAKELAPLFDSIGQHEHAARLLQVAQAHTLEGDCRYESESDTYTLVGWGTDISGRMDEFHFAYKTLEGNGSIIARIESIEDIHPCAKAGVMIRQNLDPGAQFAGAFATSGSGVRCDARLVANEKAISDFRTAMSEQTALRAPVWVRIERKDDQFGAFYSSDGKRWTRMAGSPQKISMPQGVYIGLAVTSHDRQKNAEAQFSHVAVAGDISYSAPFEDSQDICFHPPSSPDAQNSR